MHFDLGENEASHQGPICAICVDFGHIGKPIPDDWAMTTKPGPMRAV